MSGDDGDGLGRLLSDEPPSEPSAGPRRAAKRKVRKWLALLLVLLLTMVVGVGFYVIQALLAITSIERDESLLPSYEGQPVDTETVGAPMNFVLMGSDSRGQDRGRSDSLMIAHISGDRSKVYLVSFPRDMYVEIPGHGKNKINAAYSFGGVPLAVRTLESLTDVRMHHVVVTDFEGFIGLTEELDGVTVFNESASSVPALGYDYPRGDITIKGDEALIYVRDRYNVAGGDLGRAARQRAVVKAIAVKLMKPSVMANPVTFAKVAGKIGQFFTVDDKLTVDKMFELATSLRITGAADIITLQAPLAGFANNSSGAVDLVNFKQLAEMSEAMKTDTMSDYWAKHKNEQFNR